MKALFISNDTTIFDPNSQTRARMLYYATEIGELHILSRGSKTKDEQDGALFLHSVKPLLPGIMGRILLLRAFTQYARKLIRVYNIDIVSAQDPFEHGVIALRAVRNTKAKLHVQVHTDFCSPFFASESLKNRLRIRMADKVLPHAKGIRVVSVRVKESLVARYGKSIFEPSVIPIALETNANEEKKSVENFKPPFPFVLMAIGRFEKEKRFADILHVTALLVEKKYPVTLALVGGGSEESALRSLVGKLGIGKHVMFLGWRNDISELLSQSQVFIQASAYEGYGRTYIEVARAGVPMVVTNVGIIGDVFIDKESALVCNVGDIKCLKRSVERVIEENDLRYHLVYNAHNAVNKHIATLGDIRRRIVEDLENCVNSTK